MITKLFWLKAIFICVFSVSLSAATDLEQITSLRKTDPKAAVTLSESLWQKTDQSKDLSLGLELLFSYAKANLDQQVIQHADDLLAKSGLTENQTADILIERLIGMKRLKLWDEQDSTIAKVDTLLEKLDDPVKRSRLFEMIALLKYNQFLLADADMYFDKAIKARGEEISRKVAGLYLNLGVMRAQLGKLADATDAMLKSVRTFEAIGETVPADLLGNISGLYIYRKNWDKAIEYSKMAIEVSGSESLSSVSLLNNLGTAYIGKKRDDKALSTFQKSLKISDSHDKDNPGALNNLGYIFNKQRDYRKALEYFERASEIYQSSGKEELLAIAKKNLGETWVHLKDRKRAANYFEDSYQVYIVKDFRPKLIELYPVMIDNLESLGREKEALKLMYEFKQLSEEMVNVESNERIADLESAFELEKKNRELLKSERELADLERNKVIAEKAVVELELAQKEEENLRVGLTFVVGTLFVIGLLLLRVNRFRARNNQILEEKNSQIEGQHKELQTLHEELKKQSLKDELTGLKNRRYLNQFLEKQIARMNRTLKDGASKQQLIIMVDIDNFKSINDRYGHSAGDKVLRAFADVLRSCSRESDVLARWGGEEFLWFCADTSISEAKSLCERVKRLLSESPIDIDGEEVYTTCSFGFAPFPVWGNPSCDWEDSIKIADLALYEAKHSGRNRWVGFDVKSIPALEDRENFDLGKMISSGNIDRLLELKAGS